MTDLDDEFLAHFGVKGMKWGQRKSSDVAGNDAGPSEDRNRFGMTSGQTKAAVIMASAVGVAAIAAGAYYVSKNGNVPAASVNLPQNKSTKDAGEKFAKAMAQEPLSVVHAARGKNVGFGFPGKGGLDNPLQEYKAAGFGGSAGQPAGYFKKYGERGEKIAASFKDPEGRKDRAGRDINHDVMIPEKLAAGINKFEDVEPKVWPLIKDAYDVMYNIGRQEDR